MNRINRVAIATVGQPAGLGCLVLITAALSVAAGGEPQRKPENLTAEQMMIRAHQARAEWDDAFPGFRAAITVWQGDVRVNGKITVTGDGEVKLDLPESQATEAVQRRLESLVMHRQSSGEREYDVEFGDDEKRHPLGRLIKFNDDRLHSIYRVNGDVITEVHRTMGERRFTISVVDVSRNPEGKYLPKTYTISFWDAKSGDLVSTAVTHNRWKRVGRFDLPQRVLTVETAGDGQRTVHEVRFRNHELLGAIASAKGE